MTKKEFVINKLRGIRAVEKDGRLQLEGAGGLNEWVMLINMIIDTIMEGDKHERDQQGESDRGD